MITGKPWLPPVTIPVEPTDAIALLLLLQAPPDVPSSKAKVSPGQTLPAPVMAAGVWFTVTTTEVTQPVAAVKVMVVVPGVRPETFPVDGFTVATSMLLLPHEPLPVLDNSV